MLAEWKKKYESIIWKSDRLAKAMKLTNIFLYSANPVWIFPNENIDFYIHNEMEIRKSKGNWKKITD